MLIYFDILSQAEVCSDSYDRVADAEAPFKGAIMAVQAKYVKIGGENIDIGANASAEATEEDESVEDQAVNVLNIVYSHKLEEIKGLSKDEYKTFIKSYMKNVQAKLSGDKADAFKANLPNIQTFVKDIVLKQFDDLVFYKGEEASLDNCLIIPCLYPQDGTAPVLYYILDGLNAKKY